MRKKYRRKKGPVRSNKVTFDGITFASGLEKYMHIALKKAKIQAVYEGHTYEIFPAYQFESSAFERCANGKGDYKDRGNKKILPIKYTPDFIGKGFIIECKGRANESFPIRWKLFKKHVAKHYPNMRLYKPQKQSECDDVINLINNG